MTIDIKYLNPFMLSTERAAYEAFLTKGKGNKIASDQAAVNAMRKYLNKIKMNGRIVIGEGELDEAPMLYLGEKLGTGLGESLDIAVDPLEGTNFTAKNLPDALSVLAVAKKGCLFQAPETYMEKIAIGPNYPENLIDLDLSVEENIKRICEVKNTSPEKLTACILKRPRHNKIINSLEKLGVNIHYITDGDVSGVMSVSHKPLNIDVYLGIGGGPEGVLAAAALSCLGCQMQTRLIYQNDKEKDKVKKVGIKDLHKKYYIGDMVKGDVIFCATGVTDGDFVSGIKDLGDSFQAETFLLHKSSKTNKKIINIIKK